MPHSPTILLYLHLFSSTPSESSKKPTLHPQLQNSRVWKIGTNPRSQVTVRPNASEGHHYSMINAYSQNARIDEGRALFHSFAGKNVRTWTAIVTGYAKNGRIEEARKLFDAMPEWNIISWNAMISGYVQNCDLVSARRLFDEMPERNTASWNTMLTGYSHCGNMEEAFRLFNQMPDTNLVSWMVMVSGYVQIERFQKGWDIFLRMHHDGILPDQKVFVVALTAITGLNDPRRYGRWRSRRDLKKMWWLELRF